MGTAERERRNCKLILFLSLCLSVCPSFYLFFSLPSLSFSQAPKSHTKSGSQVNGGGFIVWLSFKGCIHLHHLLHRLSSVLFCCLSVISSQSYRSIITCGVV